MKLNEKLILPYSIAIGIWNMVFTVLVAATIVLCFSVPFSFKMFTKSYFFGYIFLWLLHLHIIGKSE